MHAIERPTLLQKRITLCKRCSRLRYMVGYLGITISAIRAICFCRDGAYRISNSRRNILESNINSSSPFKMRSPIRRNQARLDRNRTRIAAHSSEVGLKFG